MNRPGERRNARTMSPSSATTSRRGTLYARTAVNRDSRKLTPRLHTNITAIPVSAHRNAPRGSTWPPPATARARVPVLRVTWRTSMGIPRNRPAPWT